MILLFPSFVSEFPRMAEPGAANRSEAQMARHWFSDLHAGKWTIGTMTRKGEAKRSQKSKEFVEKGAEIYAKA
jgi:hypothetical protein